jgi:plastocyanin
MDRRTMLRLGGLALATSVAGCSGSGPDAGGATDEPTDPATATPEQTSSPTAASPDDPSGGPPGADVLGGPDALRGDTTLRAATLDSDRGAGRFVFTPAVVWVETGTTLTWNIEGASHSVTAYHRDNDKPHRVPGDAPAFDSGVLETGETFEHTFETPGVHDYYCTPHESLGMVGLVVVEEASGAGAAPVEEVGGTAGSNLSTLLGKLPGGDGGEGASSYGWTEATFDSYWYSLYNMSTNIAMSGNGVMFPHNEEQQAAFDERFPAMLRAANQEEPPVRNPNLNMAPFTEGDPFFTQEPVLAGEDGRPDASTLKWDTSKSSGVVSPSSLAWTHLKGVTWAKNFQNHREVLPGSLAALFRAEVLSTLAQIGTAAALVRGGPEANGALTLNPGEDLLLASGFRPSDGTFVDETPRPHHHAAMLWFLSDLTSLAHGGWFGYENPEPLIPPENVQELADGMAETVMNAFPPADVAARSTRDLGTMLGAVGWYGTHAGSDRLASMAADYANALANEVEANLADDGMVDGGTANQAATQGAVGQGLLWASQVDGVDHAATARDVVGYMRNSLWDDDAGTFATGDGDTTYRITARDAGDITGGLNAADAVLGMGSVREQFARFFDETFNRGRLQRAERPPSRNEAAEHTLALPPAAGGEFGQAAVYNGAVEYDTGSGEWSVADRRFYTGDALYLANQDIWVGNWGGQFYQGRGVPGTNDTPK